MIFLRINCQNFIIGFWLRLVIFKDTRTIWHLKMGRLILMIHIICVILHAKIRSHSYSYSLAYGLYTMALFLWNYIDEKTL